jgi:arylformamidase
MPPLDLEAEYNNRQRVPEHVDIQARWSRASNELRSSSHVVAELDKPYGSKPRQRFDLYRPAPGAVSAPEGASNGAPGAVSAPEGGSKKPPLVVYIHGGYWQRGDRKDSAFVARELAKRGIATALAGYTLAPEASVMDIVGELRQCLKAVWEATRQHPLVVGHSAGGHLTAAMVATDWSKVAGVPADLVRAGYAISGVFEVEPLVATSINGALKLDAASAKAASPILWPAPPRSRTLVAAVGGDESQEFIRQSLAVTAAWGRAGVKAECTIVPGANHFTVVEHLANPESAMLARVVALARQCAAV